ncbi:MAG TPA: GNAT family N-acetyltransferase [Xanthobacteraceae bacterium]|nr:GNAT family N-acetyltransferase [Xanthobacteraceae bacterium]
MTLLEPIPGTLRGACSPVLETERLVLRAPRFEDAKQISMLANDRLIAENTARIPHPYRLADAEAFVAQAGRDGSETIFLITRPDGTVVGACGLQLCDTPAPEIGYWVGLKFWGNGYATEAAHAVVDWAFADGGHEALQAGARVTNPASRRVLEKCGFQWTGVGLYRIRALASSAPIDRFRLDRGIWMSLKAWRPVRRVA